MSNGNALPGDRGGAALNVTIIEWPVPGPERAPLPPAAEPARVELWVLDGVPFASASPSRTAARRMPFSNAPQQVRDELEAAFVLGGWRRVQALMDALRDRAAATATYPQWAADARQASLVLEAY